ncbi:MAG TPA: dihydrofolate reductase family protein [Acidimicrobiales bacterium]|nr:dihydrofolate reductase family protein [Acidimicrobiales bacterium]
MRLLVDGDRVTDVLEPYRAVDRVRPEGGAWVLANMVGGLDGSAAVGGRVGALTGGVDAELFRRLRALADVVLVGAETVRAEGYGPVRLPDDLRAERTAAGRSPVPPIVVVSRSLRLDWAGPLFAETDPASPTAVAVPAPVLGSPPAEEARRHAEVLAVETDDGDALSVPALLAAIADRGHDVVLCEGGPALLGELVAAGRLDELCLTVAPVVGGDPLPVVRTPPGMPLRSFALRGVASADGSLFLRYEAAR